MAYAWGFAFSTNMNETLFKMSLTIWQVFWLPRSFSYLPIAIDRNSGKRLPKEFPFHAV